MNPRSDAAPPRPTTPRPQPGPKPSSPRPRGGHLPIGADQPALADLLTSANLLGAPLLSLLRRGFDPASRPAERGPEQVADVDLLLRHAAADVSSALLMLSRLAELLPPAYLALRRTPPSAIPVRQDHRQAGQDLQAGRAGVQPGPAGGCEAEEGLGPEGRSGPPARREAEPQEEMTALPRRKRVHVRPVGPCVWPGTEEIADRINASLRWSR